MRKIFNFMRHNWVWWGTSIIVLCFDLLSKNIVTNLLIDRSVISVLPYLNFTLYYNSGFVFGLFEQQRPLTFILSFIFSTVCLVWYVLDNGYHHFSSNFYRTSYGLVTGGALGNLYERIVQGYVTDFIDVYIGHFHFSTFNLADAAIILGYCFTVFKLNWFKK